MIELDVPTGGDIAILNTGAGDINVTYNRYDSAERERVIGMLKDMQRRGYAILVKLEDGSYQRAIDIDGESGSYVIMTPIPAAEDYLPIEDDAAVAPAPKEKAEKSKRGFRRTKVPIERGSSVAVAPSAGG